MTPLISQSIPSVIHAPPMRVCYVVDRLAAAGTETQLLALIRGLNRDRVQPSLVLLDGEDADSQALEPSDCPVLRLGLTKLRSRHLPSALAKLRRFWREQSADIVQTYFLDSTYLAVPWARLCGIRRIVRVRNNLGYWLTTPTRRLSRITARLAHVTLTNSIPARDAILEHDRLPMERIAVLENGVDLDRFSHLPPIEEDPAVWRVGMVAHLRPVKNVEGLIDAADKLRHRFPQARYRIAGEGQLRPALEERIRRLRLGGIVELSGQIDDIPQFLGEQSILVSNSHSEAMSNAVLEGMAAGRALIATDVGSIRGMIRDGREGLIIRPSSVAALATALEHYYTHPQTASRCAAAAKVRAEERFGRGAMIRRFEDWYEGLLRGVVC